MGRCHRQLPLVRYLVLPVVFAAGVWVSIALGRTTMTYDVSTLHNLKPSAQALALGRAACRDIRARVGTARFTRTFRSAAGCRAILAVSAQSGMVVCRKRYPAGSTAFDFCVQLSIAQSPAQRAAVAGLPITTGKRITYIPIPTAGPGAGTGLGTGAGTGGGIPGSHTH
jgi:hypothetical protein